MSRRYPKRGFREGHVSTLRPMLVLEHAIIGNSADFPLINRSFNLSYSGRDL